MINIDKVWDYGFTTIEQNLILYMLFNSRSDGLFDENQEYTAKRCSICRRSLIMAMQKLEKQKVITIQKRLASGETNIITMLPDEMWIPREGDGKNG